ncbi:uncharacterized protein GGS25DRAFT_45956 [Hypoxylon fragiforme]|uniref:uncharacterized protein n=1 Tax=Hypoxylon fragiforme TaxID=63214 RepID=UPI0020C5EFEA|nr:uncharacterized protein GGS25DRAFT_45956 [Hypoxylon fragiforme]KAI2614368.1 hypothetical protein GGS25DRAFT_45956 [Hypoxylon fragiforme]
MASSNANQFTVPVGTRHSIGIKIQCLMAWLLDGIDDPNEADAHNLPPLLQLQFGQDTAQEVIGHARKTLKDHGVPIAESSDPPDTFDKWHVDLIHNDTDHPVQEVIHNDYQWQSLEIRSPAMWAGQEAYDEVKYVVNLLKSKHRLRVNPSCDFIVYIGNGKRHFTADTIKRLSILLWTADPMLSRLHAPWRSVSDWCPTIRHHSELAQNSPLPGFPPLSDPIPVVPFSDTTREEKELAGKWHEHAEWRRTQGPFMTLDNERVDPLLGWPPHASGAAKKHGTAPPPPPPEGAPTTISPFIPPAWQSLLSEQRRLRPHTFSHVPPQYTEHVNLYVDLPEQQWRRIGWLPSSTYPGAPPYPERPGDEHGEPAVTTVEGIVRLAAARSALDVGMVLGGRTNYSFSHYAHKALSAAGSSNSNSNSGAATVEFREAGASLDGEWIEMWLRVVVGVVRFARRAGSAAFMDVVQKLVDQEERDAKRRACGGRHETVEKDEERRYSVCDWLEDMGLWAEAAWVLGRENAAGVELPP